MADRKISDLTALTAPAAGDYLPIVDISEVAAASKNKRITIEELFRGAPLGTAAAPSIAIEGDENTGIYSPGADQLAISTGGTGRLFIDASGNIGVGVASPVTTLHLQKPTGGLAGIQVSTSTHGSTLTDGLFVGIDNSLGYLYNYENLPLVFGTNATERLRITSAGLLGLGTSSPQAIFSITPSSSLSTTWNNWAGDAITFDAVNSTAGTGNYGPGISWKRNGSGVTRAAAISSVQTDADADVLGLAFFTHGSTDNTQPIVERLRITGAGNVGIGTSSPGELLDVAGNIRQTGNTAGTANTVGLIDFYNANNTTTIARINVRTDGAANSGSYRISTASAGTLNEVIRIDSSGRVGIGTTSPGSRLTVNDTTNAHVQLGFNDLFYGRVGRNNAGAYEFSSFENGAPLTFGTTGTTGSTTERARIDASGRLLVGTSSARSAGSNLNASIQVETTNYIGFSTINNTADAGGTAIVLAKSRGAAVGSNTIVQSGDSLGEIVFAGADGTDLVTQAASIRTEVDGTPGSNDMPGRLVFSTTADGAASPTERLRIDSSGRLLVGTSSARANFTSGARTSPFQVEGTTLNNSALSILRNSNDTGQSGIYLAKSRSTTVGDATPDIVADGDSLGSIFFQGADNTNFVNSASITAQVDGTPGSNDMPGRLVFSTTADGASSPTERMRIRSTGDIWMAKTTSGLATQGIQFNSTGSQWITTTSETCVEINRKATDGNLIAFSQDDVLEGTIAVSGTTVSYAGAHLSRWSQLPSGAAREEILRGTVLSNIDEMCSWGDEENEQLNRMQVSDVEGDPNVSGVFQAWDDDDDTYIDDFYCAMTGDFIIRIAEGVTVQRGDLLMSAGDGTAKPQDDDIIRSKTIAKVTSTNVSCTYDDGSYCVPCVLMAC